METSRDRRSIRDCQDWRRARSADPSESRRVAHAVPKSLRSYLRWSAYKLRDGTIRQFIGGWQHNALRDSFCSYRARITRNIHQVSYEMGNSIAMVKRSYHRRQAIGPARAWFRIRPAQSENVIPYPKKVPKSSKFLRSSEIKTTQR